MTPHLQGYLGTETGSDHNPYAAVSLRNTVVVGYLSQKFSSNLLFSPAWRSYYLGKKNFCDVLNKDMAVPCVHIHLRLKQAQVTVMVHMKNVLNALEYHI